MKDLLDEDLDELLAGHFRSCLDAQLGRAPAAFERELEARRRWRPWLTGAATLAACLVIAWSLVTGLRSPPNKGFVTTGPTPPPVASAEAFTPVVQSATWSRMVDEGAALVDGQPVRQLRRKVVEEIEWYDADNGAVVRTTVPQQQLFLIGLQAD